MIDDRDIYCHVESLRHRIIIDSIESLMQSSHHRCGSSYGHRPCVGLRVSQADELQARADAFADLSLRFLDGLPDRPLVSRLAGQYQDSSTSTAANYRAARRDRSHAKFVAKMGIVSEEADECVFWLRRMLNAKIRSQTVDIGVLLAEAEQLARIFGASHRTAKRRGK